MKGRFFFSAFILLIVMLLMLIGYLADQLFSLETTRLSSRRQSAYQLAGAPYGATGMAISETLLTFGNGEVSSPTISQTAAVAVTSTEIATHIIPTVCENYGSEIATRDAFHGPVTYRAEVAPNRIVFHLNTDAGGQAEQGLPAP